MRIVHVEDVFFPEAGYQVNIIAKHMALRGHEVIIIASQMDRVPSFLSGFFGKESITERDMRYETSTGVQIIRVPIYAYLSGRSIYKPGLFKLLDALHPDVLYIHGEDTYFGIRSLWRFKRFNYPVLYDDHMVEMASVNRLAPLFRWYYRTFVAPIIKRNHITVIRTVNDDYVLRQYGVPESQAPYIGFGSDISIFHPDEQARASVREELGLSQSDFVLLYAGKLDESKGGLLLAQALLDKFDCGRSLAFVVIGNIAGSNESYAQRIRSAFAQSQNKLILLPTQPFEGLARYYQCADAALFPKQCSLSYFDVQAAGLPVIVEDNSVNIERIDHNNGLLFKGGDVDEFRAKITKLANLPPDEFAKMGRDSMDYILANYNYATLSDQYLAEIDKVVAAYRKGRK